MRSLQSSTALVELFESVELGDKGDSGSFAALQFVSRRLDLGVVDDIGDDVSGYEQDLRAQRPPAAGSDTPSSGELAKKHSAQLNAGTVAEGAGLAHDAGNLLGALSLYSELLSAPGVLNEKYREYATELRLLSQRSSAMITRLVEQWHTLAEGKDCALTSLPDVVARCRGLLSRIAGQRIETTFGYGASRQVNVAGEVVERILSNLVKNAAEAKGADGCSIFVHVTGAGDAVKPTVILTVSDQGVGMTGETLGSLGKSGVPDAEGRGIGFRVVRELAALSDGFLSVSSRPGQGTSVSVEWRAIDQIEVEAGASTRRVLRGEAGWIAC